MVPQSRVQISGRHSAMWRMRSVAPTMSVPAGFGGMGLSTPPNTMSPPMPAVRFSTTSMSLARMRSVRSRYSAGSRDGAPVSGSRTWQWTTAAPARAAAMALSAIWAGLRGTWGLRSCVAPDPVTAQVMNTSGLRASGMGASLVPGPELSRPRAAPQPGCGAPRSDRGSRAHADHAAGSRRSESRSPRDPQDGEFLEGMDIDEERFEDWLRDRRDAPAPPPRLAAAAIERGDLRRAPAPLRPSVAVLPFLTLRSGEDDGVFGDLLSQEITRTLSRSKMLDVISHLSARNFVQPAPGLAEVSAALGCAYVASGTVRLEDRRFTLGLDFSDARSGRTCWTHRFRGDVAEVFAGRSSAPVDIAVEIARSMVETAVRLAGTRSLPDVQTHALLMASVALMHRQTPDSCMRSRTYLEEAIRRAPDRSELHAWLAKWHVLNVSQGWSANPAADARAAEEETSRALALNPECSFSMTIRAYVNNNLLKRFDSSMQQFEHALEIDPNNAPALSLKSVLHAFMDDGARAAHFSPARAHHRAAGAGPKVKGRGRRAGVHAAPAGDHRARMPGPPPGGGFQNRPRMGGDAAGGRGARTRAMTTRSTIACASARRICAWTASGARTARRREPPPTAPSAANTCARSLRPRCATTRWT